MLTGSGRSARAPPSLYHQRSSSSIQNAGSGNGGSLKARLAAHVNGNDTSNGAATATSQSRAGLASMRQLHAGSEGPMHMDATGSQRQLNNMKKTIKAMKAQTKKRELHQMLGRT